MNSSSYEFASEDMLFKLKIEATIIDKMLSICRESNNIETGGILVGYYNKRHDTAIISDVSLPPIDSIRGTTTFQRGVIGLHTWINHLWSKRHQYYLGEWHYHPYASSAASTIDFKQLKENSKAPNLHCPEPVMLIAGGDPFGSWTLNAYISIRGKNAKEMLKLH